MSYEATAQFLGIDTTNSSQMTFPSSPVVFDDTTNYSTNDMIASQQPAYYVSPDDRLKYNVADNGYSNPYAKEEYMSKMANIRKPRNSDTGSGIDGEVKKPDYTETQVLMYGRSAQYLVSAASDFMNASLARGNAKLKESGYKFTARQYERMADLLEKNISDINRAAQMDASLYKIERSETKSKQKVAMAATGFAVGKGSYRSTLETTDARTNYNIAMRMLKSELQTAETIRKAGHYRAQAEIERGNAKMAKIQGENAMLTGVISGVGNLINSGVSFYIGGWGLEGAPQTKETKNTGGKH